MIFRKIRHNRTSDAVIGQLERLILHGVLRPGDRLPAERELAGMVDVSRPILREALKELEDRNLIYSRHGGGTFVADVIGPVFSPATAELFRRHPPAIADYLEYRREIERLTARLAAERATDADRHIITTVFTAMRAAHDAGDTEREVDLDVEFHQAIGEAAHNIVLLHTLRSCYRLLVDDVFYNRAAFYRYSGSSEKIFGQHQVIFDAVMRGDADAAGAAAMAHMDFVGQVVHEVVRAGDRDVVSALRLEQRQAGARREAAPGTGRVEGDRTAGVEEGGEGRKRRSARRVREDEESS
ncbi:MAG: GntR family transcriptional regulator [Stappia sp.]|uniref:FCD domain-containing protein n=1 Tax=Stappia sp. TaxID=1870903 RepID=UPI000C4A3D2A|nr:GntR family transcriptional regulator [Stappia sp.]MBM21126.1 GntR family transcriptional regulator [Stappia sp.]